MTSNDNRTDPVADGINTASNAVNAGQTAKSLASGFSAAQGKLLGGITEILFGGLSPQILGAIAGVILIVVVFAMIVSSVNPSTLFNSEATGIEYVVNALKEGFTYRKRSARKYIANFVENEYDCGGDLSSMSSLHGNTYTYSTWACEITIDFEPELEEFAQHIDAHANAVNSSLQFFEEGGSKELTEEDANTDVEQPVVQLDENDDLEKTDYGEDLISSYDSEYANNQSQAYFDTLKLYSRDIFDYEKDTGAWTFSDFYMGKKEKPKTVCYKRVRQIDMTYTTEVVACEVPHDFEKEEIELVDALFGHITVPMTYDVTMYKKAMIEKATNDLVGKEMYLPTKIDKIYEKRTISDEHEAHRIMDEVLSNYEMSYLIMYLGGSYGFGYSGLITSNGFNYLSGYEDPSGAIFWAYSQGLSSILHDLPYQSDWSAGGPDMSHQCTQFAATFFYDVYGFAALRGNGSMQAEYLLKDCGRGSGCPVEFERASSPAPGAIISLYPNHVVVVDEVDDDGTVYISEGNYNGRGGVRTHQAYDGLSGYISSTGYAIKTIAIPIQN